MNYSMGPLTQTFSSQRIGNWVRGLWFLLLLASCNPLKKSSPELPIIATVPEWTLMSENSQPFGSSNLTGKVYIANFVFSRCPSVCPKMLMETAEIQKKISGQNNIALVTFTVDPEFDTPSVLYQLARKYQANSNVWSFLTYENKEKLFELYRDGYKINVASGQTPTNLFDIAHSEKMVLVDQKGQIRGYYSYDAQSEAQLLKDAASLLEAAVK
ncbi:MAG: SCO family protein [Bacteriovoracaceae bacterium]|nr:SCO family protein [Bacteriovoracaceae bacterium]